MISKSEFLNRVHGSVFPLLRQLEQERISMVIKWGIGKFILVILSIPLAYFIAGLSNHTEEERNALIFVISFFVWGILWILNHYFVKKFSNRLKQKVSACLFNSLGLKYIQQDELKEQNAFLFELSAVPVGDSPYAEELRKSVHKSTNKEDEGFSDIVISKIEKLNDKGLFPPAICSMSYDDCFTNEDFFVSEIELIQGNGQTQSKVFEGFIMELNTNIQIKSKILILQKVNFMSPKNFKPSEEQNYRELQTDDAMFDKIFHTYTENEINAKSILNKIFLKKILSLRDLYPKSIINLLIEDGKITIAINTEKNMFEFFDIKQSFLKDKFFEQFYDEVASLYKVRDTFKS